MNPGDYRNFVTGRVTHDSARLARRAVDGIKPQLYKEVDYDRLRFLADEKKFHSHKSFLKYKKLEEKQKQTKENCTLQKHRVTWQKEFLRLNSVRKRTRADIDIHCQANLKDDACSQIYSDFQDYEAFLGKDFSAFKSSTADPVWNLRGDLRFWMQDNKEDLSLGTPEIIQRHNEIKETTEFVKDQQNYVLEQLNYEQQKLEHELQTGPLAELFQSALERKLNIHDGIPPEVSDIPCPNHLLKDDVLNEFLLLDDKYKQRLKKLDQQHRSLFRFDEFGGWTEEDHFLFVMLFDQYPNEMKNRRVMLLDRLKRHLPNKTKQQMLSHEEWWRSKKFYEERRRVIAQDWQRDRKELTLKARMILTEACIDHEMDALKTEERNKQKALCDTLFVKVTEWRERKMEAMAIEMELEEIYNKEMEEKLRIQEENEKHRRQEETRKLQAYYHEQNRERKKREDQAKKRLQEIEEEMKEQARIDKERVKYREEQLMLKTEELKRQQVMKEEEEQEKEKRLEAIREQVRVIADSDPERLTQKTEAWKNRLEFEEDDAHPQKPLFDVKTFTSTQITSDPRLRLESKLREAGLHNSEYARQIMSQVKPLNPPRKDMESTIFKS